MKQTTLYSILLSLLMSISISSCIKDAEVFCQDFTITAIDDSDGITFESVPGQGKKVKAKMRNCPKNIDEAGFNITNYVGDDVKTYRLKVNAKEDFSALVTMEYPSIRIFYVYAYAIIDGAEFRSKETCFYISPDEFEIQTPFTVNSSEAHFSGYNIGNKNLFEYDITIKGSGFLPFDAQDAYSTSHPYFFDNYLKLEYPTNSEVKYVSATETEIKLHCKTENYGPYNFTMYQGKSFSTIDLTLDYQDTYLPSIPHPRYFEPFHLTFGNGSYSYQLGFLYNDNMYFGTDKNYFISYQPFITVIPIIGDNFYQNSPVNIEFSIPWKETGLDSFSFNDRGTFCCGDKIWWLTSSINWLDHRTLETGSISVPALTDYYNATFCRNDDGSFNIIIKQDTRTQIIHYDPKENRFEKKEYNMFRYIYYKTTLEGKTYEFYKNVLDSGYESERQWFMQVSDEGRSPLISEIGLPSECLNLFDCQGSTIYGFEGFTLYSYNFLTKKLTTTQIPLIKTLRESNIYVQAIRIVDDWLYLSKETNNKAIESSPCIYPSLRINLKNGLTHEYLGRPPFNDDGFNIFPFEDDILGYTGGKIYRYEEDR